MLICLFIHNAQEYRLHDTAERKIDFVHRNLISIKSELKKKNIALVIKNVQKAKDTPKEIVQFCKEYDIGHIFG